MELRIHREESHSRPQIKRKLTKRKCQEKISIKLQDATVPKIKSFMCTLCNIIFKTEKVHELHLKVVHNSEKPQISRELRLRKTPTESKQHISTSKNCRHCSTEFDSQNELEAHVQDMHYEETIIKVEMVEVPMV
jgi:hypothetical protein